MKIILSSAIFALVCSSAALASGQRTSVSNLQIACASPSGELSLTVVPNVEKQGQFVLNINDDSIPSTGGFVFNTGDSVVTFATGSLLVDKVGSEILGELTYKGKLYPTLKCEYKTAAE